MKNNAVFVDRDGVINIDTGYVYRIEDFKLYEKVIEGLLLLNKNGYKIIIITNQSGIARGYFSESDYNSLNKYMLSMFQEKGVKISGVYHCPHLYQNCICRKPNPGLFFRAAKQHNLDFAHSYAIGDNIRDLCICAYEPVKGILISNGNKSKVSTSFPVMYCDNLYDACEYIVSQES